MMEHRMFEQDNEDTKDNGTGLMVGEGAGLAAGEGAGPTVEDTASVAGEGAGLASGEGAGPTAGEDFEAFLAVVARLRAPDGCPWDRQQTHGSIARNMIEEAYEVVDAIERDDSADLCEELGDVLLNVVLQAQIASEEKAFTIDDVISGVGEKMIRRHPHVFGDEAAFAAAHLSDEQVARIQATRTAGQVLDLWDEIKLAEKQQRAATLPESLLDGVPQALPALMQAQDISRKAAAAGFDWPDVADVWGQVASEVDEYRAEATGSDAAAEEFGDVLFSLVNVARKDGIDAESALRLACHKFRKRWAIMERRAQAAEKHISDCSHDELERLWKVAKQEGCLSGTDETQEVQQ
jgi:tetrapyrrole methylase family protein/MazG family protein